MSQANAQHFQALQPGQFLQPRVRQVGAGKVQRKGPPRVRQFRKQTVPPRRETKCRQVSGLSLPRRNKLQNDLVTHPADFRSSVLPGGDDRLRQRFRGTILGGWLFGTGAQAAGREHGERRHCSDGGQTGCALHFHESPLAMGLGTAARLEFSEAPADLDGRSIRSYYKRVGYFPPPLEESGLVWETKGAASILLDRPLGCR